jgi:hypothetical protein
MAKKVKKLNCFCCAKTIEILSGSPKKLDIDSASDVCVEGASTGILECGYGSENDGESVFIVVCNECFEENRKHSILMRSAT